MEGIERSTGSHHRQPQISDTRQIKGKRKKKSIDHVFWLKLQYNATDKAELFSLLQFKTHIMESLYNQYDLQNLSTFVIILSEADIMYFLRDTEAS